MNELYLFILAAFASPFLVASIVAAVSLATKRRVKRVRAECNRLTLAHIEAVRRG